MIQIDYKHYEYECCVYVKCLDDSSFIFLLLYGHDMLIVAKNWHNAIELKALLGKEFNMKDLGTAKKILGMEIHKDKGSRKLWLLNKAMLRKYWTDFG